MKLILGRAGAGKTSACLNAVRTSPQDTWLVLPSASAVESLTAHLQTADTPLPEKAQVLDWHQMLERFLSSGRKPVSSARKVALCARICERILRDEHYFGGVRSMPRFHQKLWQRFEEWSLQGLTPDKLEQAAEQLPELPEMAEPAGLHIPELRQEWERKTREILQLWRAYLTHLHSKKWLDTASLHQEVAGDISHVDRLPCQSIYLDGFWSLSELAIQVLQALERRGVHLYLTLHDDPERPELFAPARYLMEKLSMRFDVEITCLPAPQRFQTRALKLLEETLFILPRDTSSQRPILASGDEPSDRRTSVTVLDTPSKLVEVETVARHILLLNRDGTPFDQIAVLLRSPESYSAMIQVLFERYGIPLQMEIDAPLTHSPVIRNLLTTLELLVDPIDVERVMDWLHSPYVAFPKERWQSFSRKAQKLRDAGAWRDWITKSAAEEGYEPESFFLQAWLALRARIQSSETEEMSLNDLSEAVGMLFLAPAAMKARDSRAWQTAWQLADAFAEFAPESPLTVQIRAIVKHWHQAAYRYPVGTGGVRVFSIEEPDFGEPEAVFVMGVLEGVFPRRHPEDPFLRGVERECLTRYYLHKDVQDETETLIGIDLTNRHEAADAERFRFYRCVTAATHSLYLSYPRTSEESEAIASFYLEDIRHALETGGEHLNTQFYRLDEIVPREEESLHPYDLAKRNLSSAGHSNDTSGSPIDPFAVSAGNSLDHPETRTWAAQMNRAFSVTELETLSKCPFHHLARYRMKVRVSRPGLHSTEIGTLLHDTLKRTYAASQPLPGDPRELAERLLNNLNKVLGEKETEHPPWQLLVIREYCTRLLNELAQRELRYQEQFDLIPRYFEWSFGEGTPDEDEQGDRPRDPASRKSPIQMRAGGGRTLQVCGIVDRIDVSKDQSTAMVIDYKLGEAVSFKQIEDGESFQMPIYGMAVQEHFGLQNVVFAYDTLSGERRFRIVPYEKQLIQQLRNYPWEGSPDGVFKIMNKSTWQEIQRKVAQQIEGLVRTLEQADVNPQPGSHCSHCAFGDFCRMAQGRI